MSAPATLFNHAGGGHQVKVNKANADATASLLYQDNFSGRTEMGLAGNDDFSIKVSATGGTWKEALHIDAASGSVTLLATRVRQIIGYGFRHALFESGQWSAPATNTSSIVASQQLGNTATPTSSPRSKGCSCLRTPRSRAFCWPDRSLASR